MTEHGAGGGGWSSEMPNGYEALISVFDALAAVQPEAGEHLVAAAHEAVLALKTIVDATESALAEKRASIKSDAERRGSFDDAAVDLTAEEFVGAAGLTSDDFDPLLRDDIEHRAASGIHRIDLA